MIEIVELFELFKEREAINEQIDVLKRIIRDKIHPYKIGEITTVKGWSHKGKMCRITEVWFDWCAEPKLGVRAIVLKKDGTDSEHTAGWTHWHDEILEHICKSLE